MSREFDYDKFEVKDVRDYTNEQLLTMMKDTPYVLDMLNTVNTYYGIKKLCTDGVSIYKGISYLGFIFVDTKLQLNYEMVDKLNDTFVPDHKMYSESNALLDRTILCDITIMKYSPNTYVEVTGWDKLLEDNFDSFKIFVGGKDMVKEFDYSKLSYEKACKCEPSQLLNVLRNTPYIVSMLQTISQHSTINAVYTSGIDTYEGKQHLTAIAVDTTPELSQSLIEILNSKFVPGYTELSDVVDGLNDVTILLPLQFVQLNASTCAEIKNWRDTLCHND